MIVQRADRGDLAKPERTENGWLRVPASVTRAGVFEYETSDGKVIREYRSPEQVFSEKSLNSMRMLPVTDLHPPEFLNGQNTKVYARGNGSDTIVRNGSKVDTVLLITDAELIAAVEAKQKAQCSMGYTCEVVFESGVTPEGESFDAYQRDIVYNHIAMVPVGRAGPEVRAHMDACAFQVVETKSPGSSPNDRGENVKTIKIDGVDYEVGSAQHLQAQERADAARAKALDEANQKAVELQKQLDAANARVDSANEQIAKLSEELKNAPLKIAATMKARADLESKAAKVLGKADLSKLDDNGVRLLVLAKTSPTFEPAGKSADYIAARFDSEVERFDGESNEETKATEDDGAPTPLFVRGSTERLSDELMKADSQGADHAYAKMRQRSHEAWKQPLSKR